LFSLVGILLFIFYAFSKSNPKVACTQTDRSTLLIPNNRNIQILIRHQHLMGHRCCCHQICQRMNRLHHISRRRIQLLRRHQSDYFCSSLNHCPLRMGLIQIRYTNSHIRITLHTPSMHKSARIRRTVSIASAPPFTNTFL
jgi:hypothetical protein